MDLLADLTDTLLFISSARCCVEGEAALVAAVNNDLTRILRRLRVRDTSQEQQLQQPASQKLQSLIQPSLLRSGIQQAQQWHPAGTDPAQSSSRTAIASQSGSTVLVESQQQRSKLHSRRVLSSSAYGQHALAARRGRAAAKPAQQAASNAAAEQQLRDAAAVATAAAAVCYAPSSAVLIAPVQQPQQQAQQSSAHTVRCCMPSSFIQLQAQYSMLQQQLDSLMPGCLVESQNQQQQGAGLTGVAAAGYMAGLQSAFGSSTVQQQQQQHMGVPSIMVKELPQLQFTQQAEFVGLASATLSTVQALGRTVFDSSLNAALELLVPELLQQCQQCVQTHSLQQGSQLQQQQSSRSGVELLKHAVCWRNRCLRSMLAASATEKAAASESESACHHLQRRCGQLALWIPEQCLQRLQLLQHALQAPDASNGSSSQTTASPTPTASSPQAFSVDMLTPGWQLQQKQPIDTRVACSSNVNSSPAVSDVAGSKSGFTLQPVEKLCYKELMELRHHGRSLQTLQQLLLHLHIESRLAPRLIKCLLKGCLAMHQADKEQQQHGLQSAGMQLQAGYTPDRCLALYRLLHFITAAAAKQRGLGGSCHVAEQQRVEDVELLLWGNI